MGCECYPTGKYPDYLRKGCNSYEQCHVMAENRLARTPEGRAQLKAAYNLELQKLAKREADVPAPHEVFHHVTKLGVPHELLIELRNADTREPMGVSQRWWKGQKHTFPALVLNGDTGIGKSLAAAWCVVEWARHHPWNQGSRMQNEEPCVWLDGTRLRKLGEWGEPAQDLIAAAETAALCVVDDLGRDADRRAIEAVSDVMMHRVDRKRTTILASNLRGKAFAERYGQPLVDRLLAHAVMPPLGNLKSRRRKDDAWQRFETPKLPEAPR